MIYPATLLRMQRIRSRKMAREASYLGHSMKKHKNQVGRQAFIHDFYAFHGVLNSCKYDILISDRGCILWDASVRK